MAHYDIFRQQLGMTYPLCGYALWDPYPWKPDTLVRVGDVGFIRRGKFHRLFNALCSESEQAGVPLPEDYKQLVPKSSDHISKGFLTRGPYCSTKVDMENLDIIRSEGPGNSHVSLKCLGKREGAVLFLPVDAQSEDTLARGDFAEWVVKHIDRWFEFAKGRGLGIERMEEIMLVTGYHRTKSWMNVAFLGSHDDAQVYLETNIGDSVEFPFSPGGVRGAMLNRGPEGNLENLPEEGCIFIRGFRVTRTWWSLRKHLKAAGSPHPDSEGYDSELDTELISIPAITKYRDPLHVLIDYIAEHADDCDMVLVHDDDLQKIKGIGGGISLESLKPELLMDLLRESNIEIHEVRCGEPPTVIETHLLDSHGAPTKKGVSPSSNPNSDTVQVAGLFQDWRNNLDNALFRSEMFSALTLDPCQTSESPALSQQQQQPTLQNARIRTVEEALQVFFAVARNALPLFTRRLNADERKAIRSGHVYIWEDRNTSTIDGGGLTMERWTDGMTWGPSRVREEFLFYQQKIPAQKRLPGDWGKMSLPLPNSDRLIKQTYSVFVYLPEDRGQNITRTWRLTAYFNQRTVNELTLIEHIPNVGRIPVPEGLFKSTRSINNKRDDPKRNALGAFAGPESYAPSSGPAVLCNILGFGPPTAHAYTQDSSSRTHAVEPAPTDCNTPRRYVSSFRTSGQRSAFHKPSTDRSESSTTPGGNTDHVLPYDDI